MGGRGGGSVSGHGDGEDDGAMARRNPLVDLIDSERAYVEQLALVIRVSRHIWDDYDSGYEESRLMGSASLRHGQERISHPQSWIQCLDVLKQCTARIGHLEQ